MKIIKIFSIVFFIVAISFAVIWHCSLSFQQRVLWLGITPLSPGPIQYVALKQLRKHPTRATAIALVIYTDLKYSSPRSALELKEQAAQACQGEADAALRKTCVSQEIERLTAEEKEREKGRKKNNKLAEEAVKTLCLLSGESFGSYFEKSQSGFSWGGLSDERWGIVLREMNLWAFRQFGEDVFAVPGLSALFEGISQQIKTLPNSVDFGTVLSNFADAATPAETNLKDFTSAMPDAATSGVLP